MEDTFFLNVPLPEVTNVTSCVWLCLITIVKWYDAAWNIDVTSDTNGIKCLDALSRLKNDNIIKEFYRISTSQDIKSSLILYRPCMLVLPWYHGGCKFWEPARDQLLQLYLKRHGNAKYEEHCKNDTLENALNDLKENIIEEKYHCVIIIGFTRDNFLIANCWGKDWCDDGYCLINIKDIDACAIEAWCITQC
jgi:hypothetical protein